MPAETPMVQISERRRGALPGATDFREAGPEDVEDLDALPVEEQAAIFCSGMACDRAGRWVMGDDDEPVSPAACVAAAEEMLSSPYEGGTSGFVDCWAETEARIRTAMSGKRTRKSRAA
jgi:hypothetical protein